MNTIKICSNDIASLKSFLIGGKLLDCINDQNNNLIFVIFKGGDILHITSPNLSLKRPNARMSYQFLRPITDIYNRIISNEKVVTFIIGDVNLNIPIINKDDNYKYGYDEICELTSDVITNDNYSTALPNYCLVNYEAIKADLKHGIELESFGLFRVITTPTGKLSIVEGKSRLDDSPIHLIFEYVGGNHG